MKNYNSKTAKILERGGLMIEALAMLGLISVVTPTMYKKAAERTMEVEDINTASTVRTYANAAEAYINNNYGELIKDEEWADGEAKDLSLAQITPYLPYGFNTDRSLYDYGTPNIKIVKNGNNFTAFTLFPIKENADVGQERTARIASLIGSAGGYVYDDGANARGVGGIWNIPVNTFDVSGDKYSLVTMSSDMMNDSGANMDNDKYLQRTREEGDPDGDELWRNTMRTDLYLGGHFGNETQVLSDNELHSIRNVKSLIINADTANGNANDTKYGLYIGNQDFGEFEPTTNNASAYVQGALEALGHQLVVEDDINGDANLKFGTEEGEDYNFVVSENGDIYDNGHNGTLFQLFRMLADDTAEGNGNTINIGAGAIKAKYTRGDTVNKNTLDVSLISEGVFKVSEPTGGGTRKISMYNNVMNIYDDDDGRKRISMFHDMDANYIANPDNASQALSSSSDHFGINDNGDDSLGNTIDLTYANDNPHYGVDIGSNVRVQGVLTAGQVDTQHLRTASFSSGSDKIDDPSKWLTVDKNGVRIAAPHGEYFSSWPPFEDGSGAIFDYDKILLASDIEDYDDNYPQSSGATLKMSGYACTGGCGNPKIEMGAESAFITMDGGDAEIRLQGEMYPLDSNDPDDYEHDFRVRQSGGNFDLDAANLNVTDEEGNLVFSVRGNDSANDGIDRFDNDYTRGSSADYNVAMHGNAIFTGDLNSGEDDVKYLSIGQYDKEAGVNIIATGKTGNDYIKNVLVIDQTKDYDASEDDLPRDGAFGSNFVEGTDDKIDRGTIYIRKGMIEVITDEDNSTVNKSYTALSGSGIVRASRFVANNQPVTYDGKSYNGYEVPDQLTHSSGTTTGEYERYNGSNTARYDTYMVNPAYTSVMNDIKLTTRGGARLSDILPDFINKGIYIANNSYDENANAEPSSWASAHGYDINPGSSSSKYASPYMGSIPAPQCPPGYARVITAVPLNFQMAEAGGLGYDSTNSRFYVERDTFAPGDKSMVNIADLKNTSNNVRGYTVNEDIVPHYDELNVEIKQNVDANGAISISGTSAAGDISGNYTVNRLDAIPVKNARGRVTYVLNAESAHPAQPLVFQQSTYLKTRLNQITESGGYVSGWALLMGFVYPKDYYSNIIRDYSGNMPMGDSDDKWYWNIFPVLRKSLEATATVYCYFDRNGTVKEGVWNDSSGFDHYDYLSTNATGYRPLNQSYRERLNDPTLRYNELW